MVLVGMMMLLQHRGGDVGYRGASLLGSTHHQSASIVISSAFVLGVADASMSELVGKSS